MFMKGFRYFITAIVIAMSSSNITAQYFEIANQLPSLIQPALSGSLSYKGFVELSGSVGIGTNRATFAGISTTQGFQYADWFYMGVGLGIEVASASQADDHFNDKYYDYTEYSDSKTKAMVPIFTAFRFNIGQKTATSFFLDLKLGAAWLLGDSYLRMNTGAMSNGTQFYFKPTLGLRVPLIANNTRKALNIGLCYQLLTANDNYYRWQSGDVTLSNIGLSISYEW